MTEDELKKFVKHANEVHQKTVQSDHYTPLDEQPTLNIKIGNQQFVAVEYWWENNDFIFVTDNNEEYRCANAYPMTWTYGLDETDDEVVILGAERWKTSR